MKANENVHTPYDGRGRRDVFLNGEQVKEVMYADEKRGIVRVIRRRNGNIMLDNHSKRVLLKTLRGRVEVVAQDKQ